MGRLSARRSSLLCRTAFSFWGSIGFGCRPSSVQRSSSPLSSTATWRDAPRGSSAGLDELNQYGGAHHDLRPDNKLAPSFTGSVGGVSSLRPGRELRLRASRF